MWFDVISIVLIALHAALGWAALFTLGALEDASPCPEWGESFGPKMRWPSRRPVRVASTERRLAAKARAL
jgi:hypothetical protein